MVDQNITCHLCHREFSNKYTLQRHLNSPKKCNIKLECPRCKQSFSTNQHLQRHLARKNQCIEVIILDENIDIRHRELDIEEQKIQLERLMREKEKILLEEKRIELKREQIQASILIEEAKSKRKAKTINNIGIVNNYYVTNYTSVATDAINSITLEDTIRISLSEPIITEVIKFLYDNKYFKKYANLGCYDQASETFKCHMDGKWITIRGFENICQYVLTNSSKLFDQMENVIFRAKSEGKMTHDEYLNMSIKLDNHEREIKNALLKYQKPIMKALPQVADKDSNILPTGWTDESDNEADD